MLAVFAEKSGGQLNRVDIFIVLPFFYFTILNNYNFVRLQLEK